MSTEIFATISHRGGMTSALVREGRSTHNYATEFSARELHGLLTSRGQWTGFEFWYKDLSGENTFIDLTVEVDNVDAINLNDLAERIAKACKAFFALDAWPGSRADVENARRRALA